MRLAGLRARANGAGLAAVLLFLLLVAAYMASISLRASRGASITGDEPFYLITTQSILQDGNLDLREQYERESYRSFFDHADPLWRQADPLPDGRLLSPHEPGLSVLLVPGFAIGGLTGSQIEMLLITAATFTLAYVLIAMETGHRLIGWFTTAAVALSPPAFVYATEIYPEIPAAFCVVVLLLLVRRSEGVLAAVAVIGVLSALAWLGMKYIPVGIVIAAFYLWRAKPRERAWFGGLGLASAAFYAGWHLSVFGALTPYETNLVYDGASTGSVLGDHLSFDGRSYRLWGLFVDRRFGIGRWAPLFLLVWPLLPLAWRAIRSGPLVVSTVLVQIAVASFVSVTMMGWWFPGRMLIAVLPLFALVLTAGLVRLPALRPAGVLLAAYSLLVTLLLVFASHDGEVVLAVDPFEMTAWPFSAAAHLFPNYTWWSEETIRLNAAWLTGLVVATLLVATTAQGDPGARGRLPSLRRRIAGLARR